jgi:hypothetical protein
VRHSLLAASSVRQLRGVVSSIVGWTVNEMDRALQLRRLGIDGPTSDSLTSILRVRSLRRRIRPTGSAVAPDDKAVIRISWWRGGVLFCPDVADDWGHVSRSGVSVMPEILSTSVVRPGAPGRTRLFAGRRE